LLSYFINIFDLQHIIVIIIRRALHLLLDFSYGHLQGFIQLRSLMGLHHLQR
jgi:hypothetical protein